MLRRISNVWNGRRSVTETFWVWCILGSFVIEAGIITTFSAERDGGVWLGFPNRLASLLIYAFGLSYFICSLIATWRSTTGRPWLWGNLVKIVSSLWVTALAAIMFQSIQNTWAFSLLAAQFDPNHATALVLASSDDHSVAVFDGTSLEPLTVLRSPGGDFVDTGVFSPDGTRVLTADNHGMARIWDARTGAQLALLRGHTDWLKTAAFSKGGKRVVTASNDRTVRIWNAATGASLALPRAPDITFVSAQLSLDGSRVVTASNGGTFGMQVWDAESGKRLVSLVTGASATTSAAFSPDGTHVVATSDNLARIWKWTGGSLIDLVGHTGTVNDAEFSPDGKRVITASDDHTARIWDAANGKQQVVLRLAGWVRKGAFSPDGTRVLTTSQDDTVRIWDATTGAPLQILSLRQGVRTVLETETLNVPAPPATKLVTAKASVAPSDRAKEAVALYQRGVESYTKSDYAAAMQSYRLAASQGNAAAQRSIGELYAFGNGVPRDYATARHWYQLAAAQGDAAAESDIGGSYLAGHGVPMDFAQALRWYQLAAAQGNAGAANALSDMYLSGKGVPVDLSVAYGWLLVASEVDTDSTDSLAASLILTAWMKKYPATDQNAGRAFAQRYFDDYAKRTGKRLSLAPSTAPTVAPSASPGPGAPSQLLWPVSGPITFTFGSHTNSAAGQPVVNDGIVIAAAEGTTVAAAADGRVIVAGNQGNCGNMVALNHPGGLSTIYCNMSKIVVGVGQDVKRGQAIGAVGKTGDAKSPQVYFQVMKDGQPVDPMSFLR